jgi:hypothetical protein
LVLPEISASYLAPTGVLTDAVADQIIEFIEMQEHDQEMERAMITVRVFEKREAAAEWLGVPLQILYPPSKKK